MKNMSRCICQLAALMLALLLGTAAPAYAVPLIITIDDLAEGPISVSSPTGTAITILPDSTDDFVHFTFTAFLVQPMTFYTDLLEPGTRALSDRFLLTTDGSSLWDVQFDSRDTILLPQGISFQGEFVEDGTFQHMISGEGDGIQLEIVARSDVQVPEPATLLLMGLGAVGMGGGRRLGRRRRAGA